MCEVEMIADIDVLIVEDNAALRAQLVATLASQGLAVRTAANGRKALRVMQTCRPKIMVTDLYMPEMEGLELIRLTRAMWSELKIIAMSGGSRVCGNYLPEAARFGADATLSKPFRRAELADLVSEMIAEKPGAAKRAAERLPAN
jgi:DNA-binding NtrC family response regulator